MTDTDAKTPFDPIAHGWKHMRMGDLPAGLGTPWSKRVDDQWRYGFQTTPDHVNDGGIVHGGILMTFADHCLGMYVWEAAERAPCVTIQLNTHFLDAVNPGDFLQLRGEITRRTGGMVFIRGIVSVLSDAGSRDALAFDGIWRILLRR
jgi:acyl-coenzyme A thioesterase PaaI-like protein